MTSPAVLGVGGCVDYEVKLSADVLQQLVDTYGIRAEELTSTSAVHSERDLVVSILTYVRQGGGGEHFVASSDALKAFAARFPERVALGGTSVRAGLTMSKLGVPSTLHLVTVNRHVRELLPAMCDYIGGGDEDTVYPHLIVQYHQGLRVTAGGVDVRAPYPNRLIYVNDPANELLPISDELGPALQGARVFLISGYNAIRDTEVLNRRLASLRQHMRQLPKHAFVYYEDAAFHVPEFNRRVRDALLDSVDVFGLNEDEMELHLGHQVDLLSVPEVEKALASLCALITGPTVVVHTKHWAAAVGDRAPEYAEALDGGIRMASARYCFGDDCTEEDYESMRDRPRQADAIEFAAALQARMGGAVRCVPGLDLDVTDPTTIGLGDTFVGGFLTAVSRRKAQECV
jgi:ADP-dependent phosphofructokinase/glucokinase